MRRQSDADIAAERRKWGAERDQLHDRIDELSRENEMLRRQQQTTEWGVADSAAAERRAALEDESYGSTPRD